MAVALVMSADGGGVQSASQPLLEDDIKSLEEGKFKAEKFKNLTIDDYDDKKYTWDFCIVFTVGDPDEDVTITTKKGREITLSQERLYARKSSRVIDSLKDAGLTTHTYMGIAKDEIYCLFGASERRLALEAERTSYELKFNTKRALAYALEKKVRLAERAVDKSDEARRCREDHWKNVHGRYSGHAPQEIYERYNECGPMHKDSLFKTADRLKLTDSIVASDHSDGGAGLALGPELYGGDNPTCAYFPLHQPKRRENLLETWVPKGIKVKQPLQKIRNYFGEQIGFYFSYLGFYCDWLLPLTIIGIIFFIAQLAKGMINIPALTVMAVLTIVWACLYIEFWKQKQSRDRYAWGMSRFEKLEQNRPEFKGQWIASMIDGRKVEYFGPMKRLRIQIMSHSVIVTLIAIIVSAVAGFFVIQQLQSVRESGTLSVLISILNGVQIQVFNQIYSRAAVYMNDIENHQTQTDYDNALISKLFAFKFINSYNSLFYIAFIQHFINQGCSNVPGDRPVNECLPLLRQQLATVFATIIVVQNATELGMPKFMKWMEKRKDNKLSAELRAMKTPAEKQREFVVYENMDDYDQLIVQFGYVTLFIVAFPLTPLLALLENRFQIWVDSYRVMFLSQRPLPRGGYDIGTWQTVLNILIYATIATNLGLIVFYSDEVNFFIKDNTPVQQGAIRVFVFVIAEHLLIFMKILVGALITDESFKVKQQLERTRYIVRALVDGRADDPDADYYAKEFSHDVSDIEPIDYDALGMGLDKNDPRGLH